MQRRDFSRSLLAAGATALTAGAGLVPLAAQAQVGGFKEGTDYLRLGKPVATDSGAGKVEVLEFFAYSCIHCYNFEPVMAAWMKKLPANVVVRRTPVAFSDAFVPMQRLYYTIEAMGLVDSLHEKVFRAFHVDKVRLQDPAAATDWMGKQGVDMKKFNELFNSFSVVGKAKRAAQMQDLYGVEGTPALGVGGRFYVPGQGPRTLQIADALIAELRKGA
ncbi:MAG: thiol:disulfide interchange protein DsbA/DsbL [Hydrogenophaga sp.]|uniref:thiol:disulfide interchange protein DsbA/DsbL n=1 Tax=Hydrogenophaga sp. TaxID=1904254 RepID=UPI003D9B79A3